MDISSKELTMNIFAEYRAAKGTNGDKVCHEIIKLLQSESLPDINTVVSTIDSCIKDIYPRLPKERIDVLFEPALQGYVSFMTFVSLFRAKNRDGFTYPEFIFNTFKEYLWEDISDLNIKSIRMGSDKRISDQYDEIYRYSEIVRKRRDKNLSKNIFSTNEKRNYKILYSHGSMRGHPGVVFKPIRIEKKSEFEIISILTPYSNKEKSRIQDAVDLLTFDRMDSSNINLNDDLLNKTRIIYDKVANHKKVHYDEYKWLHKFFYEFYKHNSEYIWLNIYALEKKMQFQGISEIIKTWDLYKNKYNISEEWLIGMAGSVLSLPTFGLRIKLLSLANDILMTKSELSIKELNEIALSIDRSINIKLTYTLDIFQQTWSKLEELGLGQSQLDILLKALSCLINTYADKFDLDLIENQDNPEYEEIFQKIYSRLYPPFPKQIRKKRKS